VWKLLGQLVSYSGKGQSGYDACATPNATTPPLSSQSLLAQGKVGLLWGGSWYIPQLASAGFSTAKFGVFPEPPITTASSPLASGTSTVGIIGGPNGNGQWGVTSQQARLLRPGTNVLGIETGSGAYQQADSTSVGRYMFQPANNTVLGAPKVIAQLEITYANGTKQTIATDSSWLRELGPTTFSSWWGGEDYDARRIPANWTASSRNLTGPDGAIRAWPNSPRPRSRVARRHWSPTCVHL
jgi:hypothetical protein